MDQSLAKRLRSVIEASGDPTLLSQVGTTLLNGNSVTVTTTVEVLFIIPQQ